MAFDLFSEDGALYISRDTIKLLQRLVDLLIKQIRLIFRLSFRLPTTFEKKKDSDSRENYTEVIDIHKGSSSSKDPSYLKFTDCEVNFSPRKAFIVVTDIINSTRLYNENPIYMKQMVDAHDILAKVFVRRFNGHIVANEGDSFNVVFQHANEAINFCKEFRNSLASNGINLRVRVGINKGNMFVRKCCGYKCFGKPVDDVIDFIKHNKGNEICIKEELLEKYNIPNNVMFCKH